MYWLKFFLKKITPAFALSWYHYGWALAGALYYRFPAGKLKVIGVTGTNGKSTTVHLISRILEASGRPTAALSSVEKRIGGRGVWNKYKVTMPGHALVQRFLRQAVRSGCRHVVLEVTSEGIKQHRHRFIGFDAAVFTNLAPEHLESHGGLAAYKQAKGRLWRALSKRGRSVVNLDDPAAPYFLSLGGERWGYGLKGGNPSVKVVKAAEVKESINGLSFQIDQVPFTSNLIGRFNAYNILAAAAVCLSEGVSLQVIQSAVKEAEGVPGRMEVLRQHPFTAIVDLAHTPDALEAVYRTLRMFGGRKMIGVFGSAGGGRDKWKRPVMGRVAEKYLDEIIVTSEDPRDEDPQIIIDQIMQGMQFNKAKGIADRREAIHYALSRAEKGDIVIVTGKGCEPWMCFRRGKKIPWDDRKVVRDWFN